MITNTIVRIKYQGFMYLFCVYAYLENIAISDKTALCVTYLYVLHHYICNLYDVHNKDRNILLSILDSVSDHTSLHRYLPEREKVLFTKLKIISIFFKQKQQSKLRRHPYFYSPLTRPSFDTLSQVYLRVALNSKTFHNNNTVYFQAVRENI